MVSKHVRLQDRQIYRALVKGQMSYCRITSCFTVSEPRAAAIIEAMHQFLDHLVLDGIPVFDSEVSSAQICDAEQLELLRNQSEQS